MEKVTELELGGALVHTKKSGIMYALKHQELYEDHSKKPKVLTWMPSLENYMCIHCTYVLYM